VQPRASAVVADARTAATALTAAARTPQLKNVNPPHSPSSTCWLQPASPGANVESKHSGPPHANTLSTYQPQLSSSLRSRTASSGETFTQRCATSSSRERTGRCKDGERPQGRLLCSKSSASRFVSRAAFSSAEGRERRAHLHIHQLQVRSSTPASKDTKPLRDASLRRWCVSWQVCAVMCQLRQPLQVCSSGVPSVEVGPVGLADPTGQGNLYRCCRSSLVAAGRFKRRWRTHSWLFRSRPTAPQEC
jgi:hypothetical protein